MHVWINGTLLPPGDPIAVDVTDVGFSVGHGVFQTLKVVRGVPFALGRHLDRLVRNSQRVGLPEPDVEHVRRGVEDVIAAAGDLPLGRLRVTWTGGPLAPGPGSVPAAATGTAVVQLHPMQPYPDTAAIAQVPWTRNERGALAGVKSVSFGENRVALAHAQTLAADEAVFVNTLGHLCEGATSNIFYVLDGTLCTPTTDSGCLPGVTRELLLEWSGACERDAPLEVLDRASEILLTSTTRNVQPVHRWNDRNLTVGPVARELMALWARHEREHLGP